MLIETLIAPLKRHLIGPDSVSPKPSSLQRGPWPNPKAILAILAFFFTFVIARRKSHFPDPFPQMENVIGLKLSLPIRASKLPPLPPFPTSSQIFVTVPKGGSMGKLEGVRVGPRDVFGELFEAALFHFAFFFSLQAITPFAPLNSFPEAHSTHQCALTSCPLLVLVLVLVLSPPPF